MKRYEVGHGSGMLLDLHKGDAVIISTPNGGQVSDVTFIGFDQAMSRNVNGWRRYNVPKIVARFEEGDVLVDGDRNPILRLVRNRSSAGHDLLFPGCWRELYNDGRPGCRDVLSGLFGVERQHLPSMATMFMEVRDFQIIPTPARAGDSVELQALCDVKIGLTACPDDIECNSKPGNIEVAVNPSREER